MKKEPISGGMYRASGFDRARFEGRVGGHALDFVEEESKSELFTDGEGAYVFWHQGRQVEILPYGQEVELRFHRNRGSIFPWKDGRYEETGKNLDKDQLTFLRSMARLVALIGSVNKVHLWPTTKKRERIYSHYLFGIMKIKNVKIHTSKIVDE